MLRFVLSALLLAACTHTDPASPDAGLDCCALLPDTGAIRACVAPGVPAGACATVGCPDGDAGFVRFEVCNLPVDAGAD